jgi:hypothetical protein
MEGLDCARPEQQDFVARYVGGRLGEAEAEAFEAHYFGAAAEIRDAKGVDVFALAPTARPRAGRDVWTLLAAAAAVAAMVLGLQQLTVRTEMLPAGSVMRSSHEEPLALTVNTDDARRIRLQWTPHPDAQVYVVEIFEPDGTTLWENVTTETAATIDTGTLRPSRQGISLSVTVEALDTTRQPVARSQRMTLPKP